MRSFFVLLACGTISFLVTINADTHYPTSQPTDLPSSQPSTKPSKLPTPSPTASPPPIISTLVNQRGLAGSDGDGGPATSASLNHPSDVIADPFGNLYIADTYNSKIRKVSVATGFISTIAGTGVAGFNYDLHPATTSQLAYPYDLAIDTSGNLYISDTVNNRIRVVLSVSSTTATAASVTSPSSASSATRPVVSFNGIPAPVTTVNNAGIIKT